MNVRSMLSGQLRRLYGSTSSCGEERHPSKLDDFPEISNAVGADHKLFMNRALFSESEMECDGMRVVSVSCQSYTS